MGALAKAFKSSTGVIGDAFDGIGDRISIAHLSNKNAVAINEHNKNFLGGIVARAAEAPKNALNLATLGMVRNIENGVKHADIKAMDDMSRTERSELISKKVEAKAATKHANATTEHDKYAKLVDDKYNKNEANNDSPDV